MMSLASPVTTMSYPDSFRRKIENALTYAFEQVQSDGIILSDVTRDLALQALQYGFKPADPDIWHLTRSLLLELAPKLETAGLRDEWIPYLEAGIERGNQHRDLETIGELRTQLGFIYQLTSQYENAEQQFTLSATTFARLGDKAQEGHGLIRKANAIRFSRRAFDEAESLIRHALTLVGQDAYLRGYGLFVLGAIALENHQYYGQALDYYQNSLRLWQKTNNTRLIGWAWSNLGTAYLRLGKYEECIEACQQSLKHLEAIGDTLHSATTYNTLGSAYLMSKRYKDALVWYLKAEPVFRNTDNGWQPAMLYNNCGMAYRELQEWDRAESTLLTSVTKFEKLNTPQEFADALDNLGMMYYAQQNYPIALVMYRRAMCEVYKLRGSGAYPSYRKMVIDHLKETRAKM